MEFPFYMLSLPVPACRRQYLWHQQCRKRRRKGIPLPFLEYVGIDRKDTVAVGDRPNDLEMLQYAAEGAAMENAAESLKSAADFVTDDVDEDGLYHAFERLGLI